MKELAPLIHGFLDFELTEYEKQMVLATMKKEFHASEIGKQAFVKLLEKDVRRRYDLEKAEASFETIVEALSDVDGAFESIFNKYENLLYRQSSVCLRNFKIILNDI